MTSWGVLLKEAQNVQTVGINPWLILPVFAVIVTVLAYNFLGDGLRDAADSYRYPNLSHRTRWLPHAVQVRTFVRIGNSYWSGHAHLRARSDHHTQTAA